MSKRSSISLAALLLIGLAVAPLPSKAEDIDIFIGSSGGSAAAPRVMILLDNWTDWSQDTPNGTAKITALKNVMKTITNPVEVGLAMYAKGTPNGAYIRFAPRDMSVAGNRTAFMNMLDVIGTLTRASSETGNQKDESAALFELWRFYRGQDPITGKQSQNIYADADKNVADKTANVTAYAAGMTTGFAFLSSGAYNSPLSTCAKNYIIYVAANNGAPNDGMGAQTYTAPKGTSDAGTVYSAGTPLPVPKGAKTGWADDWAHRLFNPVSGSEPQIVTYVIDAYYPVDNQDAGYSLFLGNIAKQGGGSYTAAKDAAGADIQNALLRIFDEIQAVNTTFASASLPVNATNRAQNENQVFIGMFRPDPDAKPRWFGNMKQYQLIDNSGSIDLGDFNKVAAVNPLTGFLTSCATSFWTADSSTYWQNVATNPSPAGTCGSTAFDKFSDSPDGPFVEKGGAGEVVRNGNNPPTTSTTPTNAVNRAVKTLDSKGALATFDTTNSGLAAALVNFTLGQDVNAEVSTRTAPSTFTRPSIHGDVIHSRPLPLNYGGTIGTVVYYGANDGTLKAVEVCGDSNKKDKNGDCATPSGKEKWAFIAREHYSKLQRLNDQSPLVKYPGMPSTITPTPTSKDYFFDGSIGAFQNVDNTKVWIYPSMRRGGRLVYALDVTDSAKPLFMWKAGCPNAADDTGCTTGVTGIGQTWSLPSVAFIKGYSTTKPVVILGGGYDTCEDADSASPSCGTPKGKLVYIVDAEKGVGSGTFDASKNNLLQTFATDRSVAADVTLIDVDADNMVDYAYVVDTGGSIYRIDFVDSKGALTPDKWTIRKIAATSGASRKFLFPPALLLNSGKVYVAVGSGDREHPLLTNYPFTTPVVNRFYVYKDDLSTTSGTAADLDDAKLMLDKTTDTGCASESVTPASGKNGWFMPLNANGTGEQTVTSAVIGGGLVTFSTNRPVPASGASCTTILGEARGYFLNVLNGSGAVATAGSCGGYRSGTFAGGGLPPSPVLGTIPVGGTPRTVIIGAIQRSGTGSSPIGSQQLKPPISQIRRRVYWYTPGADN